MTGLCCAGISLRLFVAKISFSGNHCGGSAWVIHAWNRLHNSQERQRLLKMYRLCCWCLDAHGLRPIRHVLTMSMPNKNKQATCSICVLKLVTLNEHFKAQIWWNALCKTIGKHTLTNGLDLTWHENKIFLNKTHLLSLQTGTFFIFDSWNSEIANLNHIGHRTIPSAPVSDWRL